MFEIITFRLRAEVDPADLLALEKRVQTELVYHQPGFLRRSVGRDDDGRWLIVQLWATRAAAEAARSVIEASPLIATWQEMVDRASISVDRFVGVG